MGAIPSQLSRYGAISKVLPLMSPGAKFFFVGPSAANWFADFQNAFPVDLGGGIRVFTTLASMMANANVVASRGDVVLVLPGHTETISSNTALTLSKAGVKIIGIGEGTLRPTFTLDTATTATINITAANISFTNCIFAANFAAIVAPFTLTAAKDFSLFDCEFRDLGASLNFVNIVDTNATSNDADGLTIKRCKRIGAGATTNTTIVKMDGTNDRIAIEDNYFAHLAVTAAGLMIIATGKIVTNASIRRNVINLKGASNATTGIIITTDGSTNSGVISENFITSLDATSEILVTASSGFIFFQNFYTGTADLSGYLLPAADA